MASLFAVTLSSVHPELIAHAGRFLGAEPCRVLVPLCGKSLDMRWLAAQMHPVLGIELASLAIEQFVAAGGESSRYRQGDFEIWRQGSIELWCGDFFHFHTQQAADLTPRHKEFSHETVQRT